MPEVAVRKADWKVDLETFEGPLDLLLHLIKKKNLDIYDIPIAEITSEYLRHVEYIKSLNLDNAGEFLLMASYLMKIKSQMLLPVEEEPEEDLTAQEMKQNLIERLIEYKKYKEVSCYFREKEEIFSDVFALREYPVKEFGESVEATLFDLIDAFKNLVENAAEEVKDIITEEISVEDKIRYILGLLQKKKQLILGDIVERKKSVMDLIVTLLAVLDLARSHQIKIKQPFKFSDIIIEKN